MEVKEKGEKEGMPSKEPEEKIQRGKEQEEAGARAGVDAEGSLWTPPIVLLIMRPITWSEGVVGS